MCSRTIGVALVSVLLFAATDASSAEFSIGTPAQEPVEYSPFVDQSFSQQVFWGDTHVHTTYSPDAGMVGNFRLGPAEAYRFARGEQIEANNGMQAKLVRPLDFLVVADHAEYMGLMPLLRGADRRILADPVGRRWYDWFKEGPDGAYKVFLEFAQDLDANKGRIDSEGIARSTWDLMVETADAYNDPGKFTAFIGYEWTSTPSGNNLHRVVIFKDDARRAGRVVPFSSFDSPNPEDLWSYMEDYERTTGGRVIAIPHNANLSNGKMFDARTFRGKQIKKEYAQTRSRFEPLHEMTQMKGDSETHAKLSPEDEFADYGTWDTANLTGAAAPTDEDLPGSYARSSLKRGMEFEAKLGVNPFKTGFIGSTDSHTSLATAGESNYFGKASMIEPSPDRWEHILIKSQVDDSLTSYAADTLASGLAAVWATENSRAAIFDAMERREAYATTGPRILVRVFGGWGFEADDVYKPDFARYGYENGVPMGGDLLSGPEGEAPSFLIRAVRDVDGANLDRVQIVKGWLDEDGGAQEKVYDVALSDGRQPGPDGKIPPVGNTVDVANASWENTIGDSTLFAHWMDPDFDPDRHAFYYARVIEIPTPRWTAYDAKIFGVKMSDDVEMIHQERAYTSPIWYAP